jgi:hypothetical protein
MIILCETVTDIAGEITEVGSAVRELKVGDKVVSKLIFWVTSALITFSIHFNSKWICTIPERRFGIVESWWPRRVRCSIRERHRCPPRRRIRRRRRRAAHCRPRRSPGPEGHRHQVRRHGQRRQHPDYGGLRRHRHLRRPARQAWEPQRHRHLRRAQPGARQEHRRRRGARL